MELQCPKCDYVARGQTEEEAREQLKAHAQTAHGMDESGFDKMFGDIKQKITGMFNR